MLKNKLDNTIIKSNVHVYIFEIFNHICHTKIIKIKEESRPNFRLLNALHHLKES